MNPKLILLVTLFTFAQTVAFAQQHPFSSQVVTDTYGSEIMPYAKGEVIKSLNVVSSQVPGEFRSRYITMMAKITDIVTNWSRLLPPQGFRASFHKILNIAYDNDIYDDLSNDPQPYYTSQLAIVFEPYYKSETGKPEVSQEGVSASVLLNINNPYLIAGSPLIDNIYICPRQTSDFYGFPVYQTNRDEITIVSKKQIPLFIPVSQEEYLRANIAFWKNEIAKNKAEQQKTENQLSVKETFDNEKTERLKAMEKAYQELLKYDKEAAEELRKSSLEAEAQVAADLDSDPDTQYSENDMLKNGNKIAQQVLTELEAELAALSPEQREKQAHYSVNAQEVFHNRSGLVPFDHAKPWINCEPLVRINKKIVDARNPEPQLMVITWKISSGAERSHNPRLFNNKENSRAHAGDKGIAELYRQQSIWQNIFGIIMR